MAVAVAGCSGSAGLMQSGRDAPLLERFDLVYAEGYPSRADDAADSNRPGQGKPDRIFQRLVAERLVTPDDIHAPQPISRADLRRVHTAAYLDELQNPAALARHMQSGLVSVQPVAAGDQSLLRSFSLATGGTLLAARLAIQHGIAVNLSGGFHHAEPGRGGGFCILADVPVAIRALQEEGSAGRVLVVDLDVHQGNGTALCVADDPRVHTFDMHQGNIYPHPKAKNDRDVPLPPGTCDEEFLSILRAELPKAFEVAKPDIVFYQAGVGGLATDAFADFAMTIDGMIERDAIVVAEALERRVPIVMVLGGGYSGEAWRTQFLSLRHLIETYTGRTRAETIEATPRPVQRGACGHLPPRLPYAAAPGSAATAS